MLPIASPDFEVGPPSKESIELARVVDRGIRESKSMDFRDLCIKEGEQVWMGFVDLYILNDDGNLFDACGVAALGALLDTKLPKLEDGRIVKGEYQGKLKLRNKPILSTFAKIGNVVVADPCAEEEKAMSARFSVTVTEDDFITAFQKGLAGSFRVDEINWAIDVAMRNSKQIRKLL
ncbi:Exosome complex component Rrp42 [uncultured archaeon]|nr:Exosome complex component Rrp42 [uncultured archaeon]